MINLFGFPCIRACNKSLKGLPTKTYLVVALLLIEYGGTVRRSSLAGYLWENRDTNLANLNLRQLLARIRRFERQNSLEIIYSDHSELGLASSISCDLNEFLSIDKLTNSRDLLNYTSNFGGEFLKGTEDCVGEGLSKWILTQRQSYSNQFLQLVLKGALYVGGNEGIKALEYLLSVHPYNEKVFQSLILLLSKNDKFELARNYFEEFAKRLNQDLNIKPETSTINLVSRLLPEMIPYLQSKYSFLSSAVYGNVLSKNIESFRSMEAGKNNNNPIPRLMILPSSSDVHDSTGYNKSLISSLIEDITLALCQMQSFVVLAPHTARQFVKLEPQPNFDVDYIISTRLIKDNACSSQKEIRLAISLTSVSSGEILVAEELFLSTTKIHEGYSEAIQFLIRKINLKVDNSILSEFRISGFASAYTFYLMGKERLEIGDLPNVRAARKTFQHALKLSPEFYHAQQMLARTYHLEWFLLGRPDRELLLKAQTMAAKIIKSKPTISGGHWEKGVTQLYLGDIAGALETTSLASSFAPYHADIIAHKADILCHNGQHGEALKQIKIALKLNPLPPDNYYWMQGCSKFFIGKYQEALRSISQTKAITPISFRFVAACHAMLGNKEKSRKYKNLYLQEYPDFKMKKWSSIIPMRSNYDVAHYMEALCLSGFD